MKRMLNTNAAIISYIALIPLNVLISTSVWMSYHFELFSYPTNNVIGCISKISTVLAAWAIVKLLGNLRGNGSEPINKVITLISFGMAAGWLLFALQSKFSEFLYIATFVYNLAIIIFALVQANKMISHWNAAKKLLVCKLLPLYVILNIIQYSSSILCVLGKLEYWPTFYFELLFSGLQGLLLLISAALFYRILIKKSGS